MYRFFCSVSVSMQETIIWDDLPSYKGGKFAWGILNARGDDLSLFFGYCIRLMGHYVTFEY